MIDQKRMGKLTKNFNNMDYSKVVEKLRKEMRDYIVDNHLYSLVLGISGGIDSALVAAIVKPVCDELNIPLIGRSISIETNKMDEVERAQLIGQMFCTSFSEVNLTPHFNVMDDIDENVAGKVPNDTAYKIRRGNIKARMRMIYLYNLASKHNGLVLSTDNLTEYLLGFWTLHGDVGDFGLIQNLWKTEVYELSEWIAGNECDEAQEYALMSCVHADATDGLGISNTDLDQILPDWGKRHNTTQSGYVEVDRILLNIMMNVERLVDINTNVEVEALFGTLLPLYDDLDDFDNFINSPVYKRVVATEFKRTNPLNVKRKTYI